jgi:uncharacterized protein (UPF0147 family)
MSELIKALIDQSKKKIEEIIKQLSAFASKQRYQLQCVVLNYIIEKTFQLNIKTKEFWHYVKTSIESWDFHYQNERAFEEAFSILSNVISSIAKARNIYEKAFKKINALWSSAKETFARNQFVQVLRSLQRCVLRNMTLKKACRAVVFAIKNRLNNSTRDVSTNRKSVNRDWIKIANENYDLRQIKSVVIISSSLVVRLKREKKSRNNFRCFLLFENFDFRKREEKSKNNFRCSLLFDDVVFDWERKKSKSNLCWFFSRLSFVVVVIVIVIYQFWIAIRHAIISIAFVINFQKYCDNVRRVDEKRRQFFKNSFEKRIFDRATSWNSLFDLVHVEIVIKCISLAKKS